MDLILTPAQTDYQTSHIHDDRRPSVIVTIAVFSILASIAIILRFLVRLQTKVGIKSDDYLIFFAWILAWGAFVDVYYETRNGLGLHVLALTEEQLTAIYKAFVFGRPSFIFTVMLTQLSILALYRRVFSNQKRWFINALYTVGLISLLSSLGMFFIAIFHCTPFKYHWNRSGDGHCFYIRPYFITYNVLIFLLDISIYVIPMPLIWDTQPGLGTKCAFAGMFLIGGFVCAINIIRLPTLINLPKDDFTWIAACAAVWAHVELCLGIVTACLPCFKPLFKINHNTPSNSQRRPSNQAPQQRANKNSADIYRTLDGKTISINGSKIALVPSDNWSPPPQTYQGPNTRARVTAERVPPREDIELGLSSNVIGVTRDFAVSRSDR